jgi:hypothetical protein
MSDRQWIDELPSPEQEVYALIARVAARGAAQANGMTAGQLRQDAETYRADDASLNHRVMTPKGMGFRGRFFVIGAAVAVAVLVVAIVIALPQGHEPSSLSAPASSRWRLVSSVRPAAAQPFHSLAGVVSPGSITCPTLTDCYVIGEVGTLCLPARVRLPAWSVPSRGPWILRHHSC